MFLRWLENEKIFLGFFHDATGVQYQYDSFSNHITGITDESNVRHQTYTYGTESNAIESSKAQTTNAMPHTSLFKLLRLKEDINERFTLYIDYFINGYCVHEHSHGNQLIQKVYYGPLK